MGKLDKNTCRNRIQKRRELYSTLGDLLLEKNRQPRSAWRAAQKFQDFHYIQGEDNDHLFSNCYLPDMIHSSKNYCNPARKKYFIPLSLLQKRGFLPTKKLVEPGLKINSPSSKTDVLSHFEGSRGAHSVDCDLTTFQKEGHVPLPLGIHANDSPSSTVLFPLKIDIINPLFVCLLRQ